MLLWLLAAISPKTADSAALDVNTPIFMPDIFCSRPPPRPMQLVRPEFKVYTRAKNTTFTVKTVDDISHSITQLENDGYFDIFSRSIIFITHGFLGSIKSSPFLYSMTDAILKEEDSVVFIVDWRHGADVLMYCVAASNTEMIAAAVALVAQAIFSLRIFDGDPNNMYLYCIGHSLGAHICGQAGRLSKTLTNEPLFDRITGLDPAGPGFETCGGDKHIGKDSAMCVDVIHTDGTLKGHVFSIVHFGALVPWGHIDFYPNGGQDQPGCAPLSNDCGCSHQKATEYFLSTIGRPNACEAIGFCSSEHYLPESCSNGKKVMMGYYSPCYRGHKARIEGVFYVNVQQSEAYC